jgi:hypothetical protein
MPHFSFCLGIEWLPTRLKLWHHRILHSMNPLKYNSWGTSCISPWVHRHDAQLCGDAFFQSFSPYRVRGTMKIPKKRWWLDHDDLKHSNEDINERNQPLQWGQPRPRRPVRISQPELPPPLLHLLNLGTRFLVVEENCDDRVIKLQWSSANDATSPRLLSLTSR